MGRWHLGITCQTVPLPNVKKIWLILEFTGLEIF